MTDREYGIFKQKISKIMRLFREDKMDDREYEILKRYFEGAKVRDEDERKLEMFESLGLVKRIGFATVDGKTIKTAVLSSLGRERFYEERRRRSRIRSFFYYLLPI